jgi:hypothetical protein
LGLSLKASAGLNAIEVAVALDLQHSRGVISRPTCCQGFDAPNAQLAKIEFIDEDIDHSHRIGLGNLIIEAFGHQ